MCRLLGLGMSLPPRSSRSRCGKGWRMAVESRRSHRTRNWCLEVASCQNVVVRVRRTLKQSASHTEPEPQQRARWQRRQDGELVMMARLRDANCCGTACSCAHLESACILSRVTCLPAWWLDEMALRQLVSRYVLDEQVTIYLYYMGRGWQCHLV
jgi:hypothetical protein